MNFMNGCELRIDSKSVEEMKSQFQNSPFSDEHGKPKFGLSRESYMRWECNYNKTNSKQYKITDIKSKYQSSTIYVHLNKFNPHQGDMLVNCGDEVGFVMKCFCH